MHSKYSKKRLIQNTVANMDFNEATSTSED
jgi:hypothetical protein